ncbi:hypothetical protein [Ruegeria lacuscaerulensis]|uniref:hypothetical protein n=1 Tax=Ruegeria lacuscaerulensis TaxID=55218 RepID=UPI0014801FB1|nr:hypothetical protein [Ruegeria lacuscaerulensis]
MERQFVNSMNAQIGDVVLASAICVFSWPGKLNAHMARAKGSRSSRLRNRMCQIYRSAKKIGLIAIVLNPALPNEMVPEAAEEVSSGMAEHASACLACL